MGRFAIVGMGKFGTFVAKSLYELGQDVVCLDREETKIKAAQSFTDYGLVGNATDPNLLSSLQVKNLDAVIVSLGAEMAESILVTLHLRDLQAKRLLVKILSEEHGRIVLKVGAHEVIFPEKDTAARVANYISSPTIMNYLDLDPEYSILEAAPLQHFIGKSLVETNIRGKYGVTIIGIKDVLMDKITINPPADYVIKNSDTLIAIGHREDLSRLAHDKPYQKKNENN